MTKQFALQQTRGNGSTVQNDKGFIFAPAKFVDGMGNQPFPGSGFSQQQNRGIALRHDLDLIQNLFPSPAYSYNPLKMKMRGNFALKELLLPSQPGFQLLHFLRASRIFQSNRQLGCNLIYQY